MTTRDGEISFCKPRPSLSSGSARKCRPPSQAAGYTEPTPIQAQAIPVAVTGRDVLGIAQTGTGKTAGFVLPMLARLESGRARARMPRSLILAPTRELAAQVAQSFEKYGVNHRLTVALLIGGVSFDDQLRKLDRGADVLIATPGRLLDHFGRGKILLTGVEILVIDEADRMLDMGFIPDIERICKLLPPRRQTLFFSATMPPEIRAWSTPSSRIRCASRWPSPPPPPTTITQLFRYCASTEDWEKREVLRELIRSENVKNAIIFCNRKRDVAILLKSLQKHGFNAGALHGDMDQNSRTATLDAFREGRITLLAASDVAARGLDIPDVSHIFNFDVPWQSDDYVHRIGRTGRAGKEGRSLTLVTPDDVKQLKDIEKMLGAPVTWIGERAERRGHRRRRQAPARPRRARRAAPRRAASGSRRREARGGRSRRNGAIAAPERAPSRHERASTASGSRTGAGPRERAAAEADRAASAAAGTSPSSGATMAAPAHRSTRQARRDARTRNGAARRQARAPSRATASGSAQPQQAKPRRAALGAARARARAARARRWRTDAGRPRRSRPGIPEEDHARRAQR